MTTPPSFDSPRIGNARIKRTSLITLVVGVLGFWGAVAARWAIYDSELADRSERNRRLHLERRIRGYSREKPLHVMEAEMVLMDHENRLRDILASLEEDREGEPYSPESEMHRMRLEAKLKEVEILRCRIDEEWPQNPRRKKSAGR